MDPRLTWWPSPAKLNLFLHINGRYPNGYHRLQTVFQLLDVGDELAFEVTHNEQIELLTPIAGVHNQDNLIVKAASLLQNHCAVQAGCRIHLNKRLPMGGGIGGGSSNAATTLLALNHLWQTNLNQNELAKLGLKLGADVPIFVHGESAFAEGVGEIIQPMALPQRTYLVAFPNCHVSTAEIFAAPELPRDTAAISSEQIDWLQTRNDCQNLVCARYPKVAKLLHWLLEYAPSRMTGTGACVFAAFEQKKVAEQVLKKLPRDCIGFVAEGVSQSPLLQHLVEVRRTNETN